MNQFILQFSAWVWRRSAFLRSGAGLAALAVTLVGLRLLWLHVQRPAHRSENAAAYGSIRNFYGPAQFNRDGSQFVFVANANDRGRVLFLADTLSGTKRPVIEDKHGVGIWNDDFDVQAGPWSPDDSCFLGVVSNRVMVLPVDANQPKVIIDDQPFSEAVWLTPSRFAYVSDGTNLCLAQKRESGQWERSLILVQDAPMTALAAIATDTVAWLEDGELICRANVLDGPPKSVANVVRTNTTPPAAGLALWLDASKLRQPDQAPVMSLPDLSRNRNDAVRNGTPPVFNDTNSPRALNGNGTIHFAWLDSPPNGTGLKTRGPLGIAGAASRSVFVVMRHEADRPMMVSLGDTSAHGALFGVEWSDRLYLPTGWWADNYTDATSTNWNLLEVIHDGAKQKGYLNGLLRCTANATLNTVENGVEIGGRDGSDAKAAEGDFAELLIYDRALNYDERKQVEDYLNVKWFGKQPAAQNSLVWYNPGLDGMTGLACAQESGQLLVNRTENGQDSIWRLDTAAGPGASPVQVVQGHTLGGAQWAGPDSFVYASHTDGRDWIKLADRSGGEKKQLLQLWGSGSFDWYRVTAGQKQLFLFGNINEAPMAGIRRNDLASDTWQPVISVSDYPATRGVTVLHEPMDLPGGNVTCTFYRPADFDRRKKYPLVIGDTMITDAIYGEPFMTGMAACGAIVAVVERPWWTVGIEQWAQNVPGLYEQLKRDPTVDTRRVYLFAASAETHYLSQMLQTNLAPWRGLILLNPSTLPSFSKISPWQVRPQMLLDAGGEEHEEDRFKKYQQDALASGVVAEFYTHPGETHRTVGVDAKLQRSRELMRFIFEE